MRWPTAWLTRLGSASPSMVSAKPISSRAVIRDAELLLIRPVRGSPAAPENVPPGTTGSSLLVLCHMMKAIVYAATGEYDNSEQCARQRQ